MPPLPRIEECHPLFLVGYPNAKVPSLMGGVKRLCCAKCREEREEVEEVGVCEGVE